MKIAANTWREDAARLRQELCDASIEVVSERHRAHNLELGARHLHAEASKGWQSNTLPNEFAKCQMKVAGISGDPTETIRPVQCGLAGGSPRHEGRKVQEGLEGSKYVSC